MRPSLPPRALAFVVLAALAACNSRQASVGSPATGGSTSAASPAVRFTTITFERTPCFGTCPVYKVSVSGDGMVRFDGTRNVDSTGSFTGRISAVQVAALNRAFEDAQYFTFDPKYGLDQPNCREYGADASRIITSFAAPGRYMTVDHDLGCAKAPTRLAELYRKFDDIVGTARWIGRR
jgi:hypothetical protein